jgi:predicted NBD/HSP70 family sugar kinase
VGFDLAAAFGVPVKVTNDAAMQAPGSYAGEGSLPTPAERFGR